MPLKVDIRPELTGVLEGIARARAAVQEVQPIEIGPREDDEENILKARLSYDRGDTTYPLTDEAKRRADQDVAAGIVECAMGRARSMSDLMHPIARGMVEAVQAEIRSGGVTGPDRTDEWEARKGNETNMVGLTGEFVASLDYEMDARGSGAGAGSSRGARFRSGGGAAASSSGDPQRIPGLGGGGGGGRRRRRDRRAA